MRLLLLLLLLPLAAPAAVLTSANCSPADRSGCFNLTLSSVGNPSTVTVQLTGTWTGVVAFEGSVTGVDGEFTALRAYPSGAASPSSSVVSTNGIWMVPVVGIPYLRLRATALSAGIVTVTFQSSSAPVPVDTTGGGPSTVGLDSASLSAITSPVCSFAALPPVTTVALTAQDVPATPMPSRTQLLVLNLSSAQQVWCCRGVGCAPTATAAYVIPPGGSQTFPARPTDIIRCRAGAVTAAINVQEASCG